METNDHNMFRKQICIRKSPIYRQIALQDSLKHTLGTNKIIHLDHQTVNHPQIIWSHFIHQTLVPVTLERAQGQRDKTYKHILFKVVFNQKRVIQCD